MLRRSQWAIHICVHICTLNCRVPPVKGCELQEAEPCVSVLSPSLWPWHTAGVWGQQSLPPTVPPWAWSCVCSRGEAGGSRVASSPQVF